MTQINTYEQSIINNKILPLSTNLILKPYLKLYLKLECLLHYIIIYIPCKDEKIFCLNGFFYKLFFIFWTRLSSLKFMKTHNS